VRAAGGEVTLIDLQDFPMPLYDGDIESAEGIPPNAKKFKELMLAHEALLISSPEYNTSITGVLKNTIDWAFARGERRAAARVLRPEGRGAPLRLAGRARRDPQPADDPLDPLEHPGPRDPRAAGVAESARGVRTGRKLLDAKVQAGLETVARRLRRGHGRARAPGLAPIVRGTESGVQSARGRDPPDRLSEGRSMLRSLRLFASLSFVPRSVRIGVREIRYVASRTHGAADGTSWSNSFGGPLGVRNALAVAVSGDQIWVAKGLYLPTSDGDRSKSLVMIDGVDVYGGSPARRRASSSARPRSPRDDVERRSRR
jgi:hypothetical protein